ncbi:hypothetical protein IFM89_037055 [Coptis chinensis]|uniref:TOD1/MUCI70 glycosyltransferase-like domain-containing protein n=1 Tax=Coptis chinensis TaxID=261450 RepID=A0A835HPT4_9MAGN|nr:hypothetical protein IFM89_037055 [Coptis chinensis]
MAQYRQSTNLNSSDQVSLGIRIPQNNKQQGLFRNNRRSNNNNNNNNNKRSFAKISISAVILILSLVLVVIVFSYYFISSGEETNNQELDNFNGQYDDLKNDSDFLTNVTRTKSSRVLKFGRGSVSHGRDSRYWDRDDRRRDDEYNESESEIGNNKDESVDKEYVKNRSGSNKHPPVVGNKRSGGLYNEAGRDELKHYEAEYEASLKNVGQLRQMNSNGVHFDLENEGAEFDDEYDDGIDSLDARVLESDDTKPDNEGQSGSEEGKGDDGRESFDDGRNTETDDSDWLTQNTDKVKLDSRHVNSINGRSTKTPSLGKKSNGKGRPRRHKYSGSSCQMKFVNSTAQLIEPLESRKFSRFSLQYTEVEERPYGEEQWEPRFSGHQSLQEREESFYARDQKINCGFIKGPKGSASTGFDLAEDDANFMSSCHIAVTRLSRKNVCFVMFMDENTLQTLSAEGQMPDRTGFIGLWKVVVVKNLPYADMRRVGKIPKFLTHRLFPSARYSIWLDSKLRLQNDPLLILEYFLWRKGYEYAISNHYDRHCLWEEVAQNKKLNKFNHTIIDQQFAFYQADGLRRFNASDPNRLLPSNVPEGSFIVRAHTPMSNLFSCLWFNEVNRFTPRDQLSFAYTHLKLRRMNPGKPFHLNMFKDCERRAIAKLFHHRPEDKRNIPLQAME